MRELDPLENGASVVFCLQLVVIRLFPLRFVLGV